MKHFLSALVSGVVALAVAVGFYVTQKTPAPIQTDQSAGYTQSDNGKFPEGAQIGDMGVATKAFTIGAGVDQVSYRNTSGRVQYVDLVVAKTSGTASSTFTITSGTSTAATFNGFSVPYTVKTLLNFRMATSSLATTTNSIDGAGSVPGTGGVATLQDGEYLNVGIYQTFGTKCTGSLCETSTSTNRGFNVSGFIRVTQVLP